MNISLTSVLIVYLVVINIIAFALYGIDKHKAEKGKWRISENTLIAVAALGGCIGAIAGMTVFHHKTRKKKFSIGLPVIFIIWAAAIIAALVSGWL